MGKRKRNRPTNGPQERESEYEPRTLLTVNSHEDVADSEDEFYINRDKILLNGDSASKRTRLVQQEDEFLEPSDEEILPYGDSEEAEDASADEDDEDEDVYENEQEDRGLQSVSDTSSQASENEDDDTNWGASKSTYYNTDKLETEQDFQDEEQEARRLQQKRLKGLQNVGLGFDEADWRDSWIDDRDNADQEGGIVTEILPQLQITPAMTVSEKEDLLYKRYPEFKYLVADFLDMKAVCKASSTQIRHLSPTTPISPLLRAKHQAATAYLSALTLYFALLTSTAGGDISHSDARPLPAHELREHQIMDTLVQTRDLWTKVKDIPMLETTTIPSQDALPPNGPVTQSNPIPVDSKIGDKQKTSNVRTTDDVRQAKKLASDARRAARAQASAEAAKALDAKIAAIRKRPATKDFVATNQGQSDDSDSSLGDEVPITADLAVEKARKRKSLRFYTSQIAQKANKRERASHAATGGDDDLPYRERWRDKVERLNREAEKRGRKKAEGEEILGGSEDETTNLQREMNAEHSDYEEDDLTAKARAKKASKAARDAAHRAAHAENAQVIPYEKEEIGPDGRRQIGYAIQKNKGLTPKRKKEVKNPRVKKRRRFEDKSKKLRSMKPTYKGGEGKGGYGGELTGIKSGLVRSVKL